MCSSFQIINLKVEYSNNPVGIERKYPRFSWEVETCKRSWIQSAYQILVSDTKRNLQNNIGDVWDSGKVKSKECINVKFDGIELSSEKRYFWKVRVWDGNDCISDFSEINYWEMGLLYQDDWKGKWIGQKDEEENIIPIFRREFKVRTDIKSAKVYICGLGHYELYLNGEKVGNNVLDTGWTNYRKRCLYSVYDVVRMLKPGGNAFGVMLGNGMFNVTGGRYVKFKGSFGKVKFIMQMRIEYEDGSSELVISDDNWRMASGPITFSCIYGGEDYDARREQKGWASPDFIEDRSWLRTTIVDSPGGELRAQINPPIKVMKTFKPISISEPKPGVYVYDFGQNLSGWVNISVQGLCGTKIKLTPSELFTMDGLADQRFTGSPYYFLYTLKGESIETWSPRFSYYGFRYVQLEGAVPAEKCGTVPVDTPVLRELVGEMIYPEVETAGDFKCSDPLFNSIHKIINWAILCNMKSVLTDCPHREKLGWLEQTHLIGPGIMYSYDVHNLYIKIMNDIKEAQCDNGLVPDIAPEYVLFGYHEGFRDSPEWGSASVIDPWYLYRKYGDIEVLRECYEVMCKYVDYLTSRTDRHILRHGLGDWLDVGPTPPYSHNTPVAVTATSIYFYDVTIMESVAALLGKKEDAEKFGKLAKDIKVAFNHEFFDNQALRYVTGSQASNAMPLFMGMVDKQYERKVLENLVKDIRARGNHTTAGDIGHPFVLMALTKYDRSDVIADMLKLKDQPSYGYQIENGATTLCEDWDGPNLKRPHGSQNHFMLGGAEEWFYSGLAGIMTVRGENPLNQIVIKPHFAEGIDWVEASHHHPYGMVNVEWNRVKQENKLILRVTIPANATGVVYLPVSEENNITEGGKKLHEVEELQIIEVKKDYISVKIGSGNYSFLF